MTKGLKIVYTPDELSWLEERATMPRRELHAEFVRAFGRKDVAVSNIKSLCTRKGWKTGRTGQFATGYIPSNKGRKGYCAPGCEAGWFKKGERRGVAKKLYKPIGTERVSKDGYIERKVNDDLPLQWRWRAVHLIRWEEVNGPVPEGYCLKCLDSDKSNTDPENWVAIPRSLLPRLNGRWTSLKYDDAEPEIRPLILIAAKVDRRAKSIQDGDSS